MEHISPMTRVGYVFQQGLVLQCMDGYSDDATTGRGASLSAARSSDPSLTLSRCRPLLCGTSSSLSESVVSTTSALVDYVVHASCDIGHTWPCQLSAFIGGDVQLICDAFHFEVSSGRVVPIVHSFVLLRSIDICQNLSQDQCSRRATIWSSGAPTLEPALSKR